MADVLENKSVYTNLFETVTSNVYLVNGTFYLVVPKSIGYPHITFVLENKANDKLNTLANTNRISIIRPFRDEDLDHIDEIDTRFALKGIISKEAKEAKQVLGNLNVPFNDDIVLETSYNSFAEWFNGQNEAENTLVDITRNFAMPPEVNNADVLPTGNRESDQMMQVEQLLEQTSNFPAPGSDFGKSKAELQTMLDYAKREQQANSQIVDGGSERGKVKVKSNGHSTITFDDGFINIILLSIVTMVVTIGTVVSMLFLLR
ncbi:MAG: hypothetical protein PHD02_01160 [Bacilli bacterium]|nr:hypothetical protein [Bacilli bacterium]